MKLSHNYNLSRKISGIKGAQRKTPIETRSCKYALPYRERIFSSAENEKCCKNIPSHERNHAK